jgi:hypothetical protein
MWANKAYYVDGLMRLSGRVMLVFQLPVMVKEKVAGKPSVEFNS